MKWSFENKIQFFLLLTSSDESHYLIMIRIYNNSSSILKDKIPNTSYAEKSIVIIDITLENT